MERLSCWIAAAGALAACGGSHEEPLEAREFRYVPESVALPPEGAVLPSRFVGGLVFVEARVDDLEPAWFLLDTGYDANVVDARFAARLRGGPQALERPGAVLASSGETRRLDSAAPLRRVALGALDVVGVDAVVQDLSGASVAVEVDVAGILGSNTFAALALTIDWPARAVSVSLERLAAADPDVVPLLRGESLPFVELELGGSAERFLVDSGSNETLAVTRALAAAAPWASAPRPFALATTAAGTSPRVEYGRLGCDVRIGAHVLERPICAVSLAGARIGCGALEHFRVTLDAREGLARFARESSSPVRTPAWRGHGAGWREVDGRVLVLDLVPGSPAETAGLRVGDELAFHGSGPLDELGACGEPHRLATDFDGELACVRRDGATLHLELANVDLVP